MVMPERTSTTAHIGTAIVSFERSSVTPSVPFGLISCTAEAVEEREVFIVYVTMMNVK